MNGTCYSPSDCRERGGSAGGVCASGFGVCCMFQQHCGKAMGENTTYLQTDVSSSACMYTICKSNPFISLLRLDFNQFDIAPPFTCRGSSASVSCSTTDGPLIGDCIYDSFTVTSPGSIAPPVICGYNTGQHMYVPASDDCNSIIFNLALSKSHTRNWSIKVHVLLWSLTIVTCAILRSVSWIDFPTRAFSLPLGVCNGTQGQVQGLWQTSTIRIQIHSTCQARSTASAGEEKWASVLSASHQVTLGWATCLARHHQPPQLHGALRQASQTPFAAVRIHLQLTVEPVEQMTLSRLITVELLLLQTG